ncbi:MAG TPA: endo-1,4-beta-xylanase [Candidatus Saccharimonadales bacterium]|nr:endo-1,4-beta-xylanase [Candidatus Saccharimonadales bacterium]
MRELLHERLEIGLRGAAAAMLVGALAVACSNGGEVKPHDVLSGTWNYMPGVQVEDGELHVRNTDLSILELEESGRPSENPIYTADSPVNLYGTHLKVADENKVGLSAEVKELDGSATLSFLQAPQTRYDERLERPAGLSVQVDKDSAKVMIWDGASNKPSETESMKVDIGNKAQIAIDQRKDGTTVSVNRQKVTLDKQLLHAETWIGLDATKTWDLSKLQAYGAKAVDVSKNRYERSDDGLYGVMKKSGNDNKYIGTAVDMTVLAANPEYERFVATNFNEIEPEMAGKFQALQPKEGQFEFGELDAIVEWAETNEKQVHGHTLAFTEAYPKWLSEKLQDPNTSADETLQLLRNHIKTVVGRYDGRHGHGTINAWDVVNEPFDPKDWSRLNAQNIWYQKLGPAYIGEALKAAHEANPNAKLYINEWSLETDADRRDAMVRLVKDLQSQGVPLDGIGFQSHFDAKTLADDEVMNPIFDGNLKDYLQQFTDLGLDVRISEASVAEAGNPTTQSDTYEALAESCMRVERCVGVNIWGASNSSYKNRYPYFTGSGREQDSGDDAPTIQKQDGEIILRPAYGGLKSGLSY